MFALLRRLHDELGVNTTCGASNVSFGLPSRNQLNGAFLAMAIANGLTRAITSPLHDEVREAVRAADVMMGNDRDCNAWIATHREQAPTATEGRAPRAAAARRGSAAAGASSEPRASSSSRRAGAATSSTGRRCSTARASSASTSTRSAAGAGSAAGARSCCPRASTRSTASRRRAEHLGAFNDVEVEYRARARASPRAGGSGVRPSVLGDVVIDVPPDSQVHRQVVRKEADAHPIEVDPVVRLHYVEVERADARVADRATCGASRTRSSASGGSPTSRPTSHVLHGLQPALRDGDWAVTVAVYDASMIIAVWPGYHDRALGIAFDVGSTTVAGHLCDLSSGEVLASAGAMNPQIRFGEDLMSRVSYVMMNPGVESAS